MDTFAEELAALVEKWRDTPDMSDMDIVNALMDEIERLDPDDDD